jgi:hypothetical protein
VSRDDVRGAVTHHCRGTPVYSTSKAALNALTRVLAADAATHRRETEAPPPAPPTTAGSYPDRRRAVVTIDEVRAFASTLPRSSEALVRGRVKFRIGRIVYLSFSRDGTVMGFAFPKEWRDALVDAEPEKFSLPSQSDLRYHWVHVRLAAIDADEMRDLVEDAWALCVPKRVAEEYSASRGSH